MRLMDSLFNRQKKQKGISIWAIILTILLSVNLSFFYLLGTTRGLEALWTVILGLPLLVIDFIVVLFYVIKQKPHGTVKLISYIILTVVSLMLIYFVFGIVKLVIVNAYFL